MRKLIYFALVLLLGAACGGGPERLDIRQNFSSKSDRAAIFGRALSALLLEGYSLKSQDVRTGIIMTEETNKRLTTDDADCGSYMGIPYLGDSRTVPSVRVSIVVQDLPEGGVTYNIITNINAKYQANAASTSILSCFSKGTIEARLASKIN